MKYIVKPLLFIFLTTGFIFILNACKKEKDPTPPIVTTAEISTITQTSAMSGGNVTDNGGEPVVVRGVCWDTSPGPTISDNLTADGSGTGAFTSSLGVLDPGTTYYVQAYATNSVGTGYGNQVSFSTNPVLAATLTTSSVTSITPTSAVAGGNITSDGGGQITARGICWSLSQNPTIDDNFTSDGAGAGSFTSNLTGLSPGTTYYVRAYATNSAGTTYGNEVSFTSEEEEPVADFSINPTTAEAGEEINFTNNSQYAASYLWDFGDGNTSTEENPDHTFSSPGNYTITLTASTEGGNTASKTKTIEIKEKQVTIVPGHELTEDETWSGELILKGDIKIPTGRTLTIEPGTIIRVSANNPDWDEGFEDGTIDIYSRGNIVAIGSIDNIIVFTSDDSNPLKDDWWGFGLSYNSSIDLRYCCISYSDNGLFLFSGNSSSNVENCMFACTGGIVDFGPNSALSHNTFINGNYGYKRYQDYRTATISYCVFNSNKMIDVEAVDSYTNVTINNSNFIDNEWYNLYISDTFSPVNITITAENCFGITTTDDNGCGTISVNSPSATEISAAGCGFDSGELPVKSISNKGITDNFLDPEQHDMLIKSYNEKDKNYEW